MAAHPTRHGASGAQDGVASPEMDAEMQAMMEMQAASQRQMQAVVKLYVRAVDTSYDSPWQKMDAAVSTGAFLGQRIIAARVPQAAGVPRGVFLIPSSRPATALFHRAPRTTATRSSYIARGGAVAEARTARRLGFRDRRFENPDERACRSQCGLRAGAAARAPGAVRGSHGWQSHSHAPCILVRDSPCTRNNQGGVSMTLPPSSDARVA